MLLKISNVYTKNTKDFWDSCLDLGLNNFKFIDNEVYGRIYNFVILYLNYCNPENYSEDIKN